MTRRLGWTLWPCLVLVLMTSLLGGLLWGSAPGVGAGEVLRALLGRGESREIVNILVFELRLPRVLLLALAGAALAVTGASLQAALHNPLAAPGLLGVSSGASLGAVLAYTSGAYLAWSWSVPAFSFLAALGALLLVYTVAHAAGKPTTGTLILTGVAISGLFSAIVSLLLLATAKHRVHEIFAWLLGSADNRSWEHVRFALGPVLVGVFGLIICARLVDALTLGEEHALGIGVDILRARALIMVLVALAAGGAVSVVGPIGFVGLMVPHLVRALAGASARRLLPAAALFGASFLVLCDLLARWLSRGSEIPVGVVTSLAGVVFFLVLLHRLRCR